MTNPVKYNIDQIKKIPITNFLSGKRKNVSNGFLYENCLFCEHKWHFRVDIEKNLFLSYSGCVKGGDVIDFIRQKESFSFSEAIEMLGNNYNIEKGKFETIGKKQLKLLKFVSLAEEERLRIMKNDFFNFLKIMEFDKTFEKCLKMSEVRLISYIYNLENIGVYKVN